MQTRLREYTSATLEQALSAAEPPLLVHFGTDWCPPCKKLEKILLELLRDEGDSLRVGKVNVEDQPELARTYSVTRNPTVCVFREGQLVARHEGFTDRPELLRLLGC
jgi:thioredoxin 1